MSSVAQTGIDLGKAMDSSVIETGLRELNVDINFDVGVRKPSDAFYTLTMDPRRRKAVEAGRMPVCFRDNYICSMDRGMVPEYKIYGVAEVPVETDWADADKDGASIRYETIPATTLGYEDLRLDAGSGKYCNLQVLADGRVARLVPFVVKKTRGRILQVGWRFTFNKLIQAGIPGVTALSVGARFWVDMFKFPMGAPEEVHAALSDEWS